MTTISALYPTH